MKPKASPKSKSFQGEGPNWVLIAGGALLSTLSIRLGFKLKQALDTKHDKSTNAFNGLALYLSLSLSISVCIYTHIYIIILCICV